MKLSLRTAMLLTFAIATSALSVQSQAREINVRDSHGKMAGIVLSHHDRDGAYYGKHKLGRDPDPNVREAIIDAHIYERGAY